VNLKISLAYIFVVVLAIVVANSDIMDIMKTSTDPTTEFITLLYVLPVLIVISIFLTKFIELVLKLITPLYLFISATIYYVIIFGNFDLVINQILAWGYVLFLVVYAYTYYTGKEISNVHKLVMASVMVGFFTIDFIYIFIGLIVISIVDFITIFLAIKRKSEHVKPRNSFAVLSFYRGINIVSMLGLGDIFFMSVFLISIIYSFGVVAAIFAYTGLVYALYYMRRYNGPQPAIPPLFIFSMAGLEAWMILNSLIG